MPHPSNFVAGDVNPVMNDDRSGGKVIYLRAEAGSSRISNALCEGAINSAYVIDARSIFKGSALSLVTEAPDLLPVTVAFQADDEKGFVVSDFDYDSADFLRANPSLIDYAYDVLYDIQDFLDGFCAIKSYIPLDKLLDESDWWRQRIWLIKNDPMKQEITRLVREGALDIGYRRIQFILEHK